MAPSRTDADIVASVLEDYARRGVFRAFSRSRTSRRRSTFRVVWHYRRPYELVYDASRGALRLRQFLPNIEASSAMYRELKAFIKSRCDEALPEHRRIDPERAVIRTRNQGGLVSLSVESLERDPEYATKKLVQLVHEIFLSFLRDGPYYEYLVENFDLEPDER